ncbi:rhodanese, partial [Francisella tularensis subsp. holarctica]|nr:rhodanese [Francisella tularensis subsp. holarctica]
GSCFRSALAEESFQHKCSTNVVSIAGGIKDWLSNNYPVSHN